MTDATPPTRYLTLDGLRGIAVMGILLMNIASFALPPGAYANPRAYGGDGVPERLLWLVEFVFVDGKMRALFSALFGASALLVIERAEMDGRPGESVHFARMGWLLAIGLLHLLLVWSGDILVHYALVGSFAVAFRRLEPAALLRLAAALFAVQLVLAGLVVAGLWMTELAAAVPDAGRVSVEAWAGTRDSIGVPTPAGLARQLSAYRGDFAETVAYNWSEATVQPLTELVFVGAETLGLMLLGMAALKSGFATGGWSRAAYRRVALWAYALSVPPSLALALSAWIASFPDVGTFAASYLGGVPLRPVMIAGHAAIALLWLTGGEGGLRGRVAAAGRMAFSNYLATSLLMTGIFYGWGLGLFGHVGRVELLPFVFGMWGLMLSWSRPWLARFHYGPFEWLWRSLARGSLQPLLRRA